MIIFYDALGLVGGALYGMFVSIGLPRRERKGVITRFTMILGLAAGVTLWRVPMDARGPILMIILGIGLVLGYLIGMALESGGGWWPWRRRSDDEPPAPSGPDPEDHQPEAEPVAVEAPSAVRPSDDEVLAALDFEPDHDVIYDYRPCPACGLTVNHVREHPVNHLRPGIPPHLPESVCSAGPDPLNFWRQYRESQCRDDRRREEPAGWTVVGETTDSPSIVAELRRRRQQAEGDQS